MNRLQKLVMLVALPLLGIGIGFVLGRTYMLTGGAIGLAAGLSFFLGPKLEVEHPRENDPEAQHTTVVILYLHVPKLSRMKRLYLEHRTWMLKVRVVPA